MPRDKPIGVVSTMSDKESYDFAQEIYDFLKTNGFHMKDTGVDQGLFAPPFKGIGRHTNPDGSEDVQLGSQ
jgi:hypothetical protein